MTEIRALTSLRGIAAMMVVMQHFSATAQRHALGPIPSLVPHGYMAVSLFFVLSGFIMAYTYQADFARRGWRAMPSFLLKRAARILPLNSVVVLGIVMAGGLSAAALGENLFFHSADILFDAVCNMALLQTFGAGMNLNGPSWSIGAEFAAYLLFPVLLALTFSRRMPVVSLVAAVCAGALAVLAARHVRLGLEVGSIPDELTLCFSQFCLGLLTFRLTLSPLVSAWLRGDGVALAACAWVAASLALRVDLLAAAGFPAVVATLACNRGRVGSALGAAIPYFFGEISFSIYLLHDPCRPVALALLRAVHPERLGTVPALGFALAASLLTVPLAWVAYTLIERPGRRLIRELRPRRVRVAPAE